MQNGKRCVMTDHPSDDESTASQQRPAADPAVPAPGQDSTVDDWMGQSIERDSQLAEELTEEFGEEEAEKRFDEQATGRAEQEARHGDSIDPDQGQSAYHEPN